MKVRIAIGQYEFIEVDTETPAQARDAYEAIRAFFPADAPQPQVNTQSYSQPPQKSGDADGKWTGTAPEGVCQKCGADNVTSPKTGKVFCTAKCWVK